MTMLEEVKLLLGFDIYDESLDNILNLYIRRATNAIKGYCNYKDIEELPITLNDAVIELAAIYYKNKGNEGITQQSQGSRSATFGTSLPIEIQNICNPYKKIRIIG